MKAVTHDHLGPAVDALYPEDTVEAEPPDRCPAARGHQRYHRELWARMAFLVKRTLPAGAVDLIRQARHQSSHGQWLRAAMYADLERELKALCPQRLDVVEVSGEQWASLPWRSHQTLTFPEFDLCEPPDQLSQFDIVICDQVLEHVIDPIRAVATLRQLMRPSGHLLVGTPFLVRLHYYGGDYWRFTPDGLKVLLEFGGLRPLWLRSWGNRSAVIGNLYKWKAHRPWHNMRNEPMLPVVIWTMAVRID